MRLGLFLPRFIPFVCAALFAAQTSFAADQDSNFPVAGQLDDTATVLPSEGDYAPWRITAQRAGHVNLRNVAGTEVGTAAAPIRIDPTGTTTQPVSDAGGSLTVDGTVSVVQVTSPWVTSAVQSGTWTVQQGTPPWSVSQSGTWTTGRTWTLGVSTDSINALFVDSAPATQTITVVDSSTATLVGANSQAFYFGAPTANSAATFTLTGTGTVSVYASILGGGGTLVVEVSMDGGTSWFRPNAFQPGTQTYSNSYTAPFGASLNVAGMTHVRVRAITSWAGTATITVKESQNPRAVAIGEALPPGGNSIGSVAQSGTWTTGRTWTLSSGTDSIAAVQSGTWNITNISGTVSLPTGAATSANQTTEITALQVIDNLAHANDVNFSNGVPVMGQFDDVTPITVTENNVATLRLTSTRGLHTNLRTAAGVELLGQKVMASSVPVTLASDQPAISVTSSTIDGTKTTYTAAATITTAASPTDIFTLIGSATKTVRITNITVSGIGSAGGHTNFSIVKRSAADTGGTSATITAAPYDSANAAATAVARSYTANPAALGAIVGVAIRSWKFFVSGAVTVPTTTYDFDFGTRPSQAIVLRGVAENIAINAGATTITGGSVSISIEWTEE